MNAFRMDIRTMLVIVDVWRGSIANLHELITSLGYEGDVSDFSCLARFHSQPT